jgi:GTP-binding protein
MLQFLDSFSCQDEPMKISSAEFIKSATRPAHYPEPQFPEIAFAGRSNVGKSTLINVLLNRRNLVRTSATPGRTQLINFFNVNQRFVLVDLPGYGFAKVPVAVRKAWGPMVRTYLEIRDCLAATVFIIDIRRTPGEEDLHLLDWLEEFGVPTIPVLSKIDKVSRSQRRQHVERIAAATGLPVDAFSLFSALSREGVEDIHERIESVLEQQTTDDSSMDGETR